MNHSNDCKSKWRLGSQWMAIAFAFLSVFTFSCDDETENKEVMAPSELRYASVSEVYEGKAMETASPVVFSTGKSTFEIAAGTAEDGGTYIEGEFQIVDTVGVIKLEADNQLVAGTYSLDIKVSNSAGETTFPNAFELIVLPSAIEGLQYTPFTQTIVRGLEGQKTSVPVFKGSNPATFELLEAGDFIINAETGEVSLPLDSEIQAGDYNLTVKVLNAGGTATFEDVITIQLETKAEELLYTPQSYLDVQQGQAMQSSEPTVGGTAPFTFELKDNMGAFTIDANTGVISLPVDHALDIDTYNLTVVVTNAHGSTEFANAASIQIVEIKAVLPSNLQYATNTYVVNEAFAFESVQPTVSGSTPMTFSLVDDRGAFVIDANTGVVSLIEGNTLTVGEYPLSVKATNIKGEVTFADAITVTIKLAISEVIFEDGWDTVNPSVGEKALGNMLTYSAVGDPVQASNNKWTQGWGNWGVKDQSDASVRGASMIPAKKENDDWLLAPSVDLTNCVQAKLNFAGYSKYGIDASTLTLLVAENYTGDVDAATWVEVAFDQLPTTSPSADREVDLSQFDGKNITIALRHSSLLSGDLTLIQFSRSHFIVDFKVNAIRK
ncbi:surface glycan-binding family protein [Ancylomarina sp. YFZ004]